MSVHGYPSHLDDLANYIEEPLLPTLVHTFLWQQLHPDSDSSSMSSDFDLDLTDMVDMATSVFHSAAATFFAPSDVSGTHGMCRELIRSTPSWRGKGA